jgi:UDP-N-acetylglucosamine acyltransferase
VKIHPTAVIDPEARIGPEVEIGPYSIVGPQVLIDEKSVIGSHAVIEGDVELGARNVIGHGAIIGTGPQDLSFDSKTHSGVRIGNDNCIREYCTIHRGTVEGSATTLGDKNFLMAGAHVGHNCAIGSNVIIANNCLLGGYVEIGDSAFLGGGCVFHQFMRVGRLAITQGSSAFSMDIPPFVIGAERNHIFGLNVVGLKRAGFSAVERDEIKAAFKLIYQSGLNRTQALACAVERNWGSNARDFFAFVEAAKKRGICAYRGSEGRAPSRS